MTFEPFEAGYLHRPAGPAAGALVVTHGAGSNSKSAWLIALANEFASRGILVYRYDLPFRLKRPHGPPNPAKAADDREGVKAAVGIARSLVRGRVWAGGQSYGGRQTSMAVAEDAGLADGLLLLSYPLHAPGKPEQPRTAHFPELRTPVLFVHGSKDPFGSPDELRAALEKIPATSDLYLIEGAGHDLGRGQARLAGEIADRAAQFFGS